MCICIYSHLLGRDLDVQIGIHLGVGLARLVLVPFGRDDVPKGNALGSGLGSGLVSGLGLAWAQAWAQAWAYSY